MSFRDPFEVLGLERKGATVKDVKRAYAIKLKTTRPDEDPKGFMELRSALENAIQQVIWDEEDARYEAEYGTENDDEAEEANNHDGLEDPSPAEETLQNIEPSSVPTSEQQSGDPQPLIVSAEEDGEVEEFWPAERREREEAAWIEPESELDKDLPAALDSTEPTTVEVPKVDNDSVDDHDDQAAINLHYNNLYAKIDAAHDRIRELLDDPDRRKNWDNWLTILDDESVEDVEAFQMLSYRLRTMICELTGYDHESTAPKTNDKLSPDIILKLDDRYGWSRQSSQDWMERAENTWVRRVVEDAEDKTGRSRNGAWGKAPRRRVEKIDGGSGESGHNEGFSDGTNVFLSFLWLIVRLVAVFAAIRLIGGLFD